MHTLPFSIAIKKIKYLVINLTKEMKGIYYEKFKFLKKQTLSNTNKYTNKKQYISYSRAGRVAGSITLEF